MNVELLFRATVAEKEELEVAREFFPCKLHRSKVSPGSLVLGRYSVLPYYQELEADLLDTGAELINSSQGHDYVSDLGKWVPDLGDITPRTWSRLEDAPDIPLVLKGQTNSRKDAWKKCMFAANKKEAGEVYQRLSEDGLIGSQRIYCREFVPLVSYGEDVAGVPIAKEFRFFILDRMVMASGFYWSNHQDVFANANLEVPDPGEVPASFLNEVISRIGFKVRFYTVDIAQTADGHWIVIELNDGQMSGLSGCNAIVLYANISNHLRRRTGRS